MDAVITDEQKSENERSQSPPPQNIKKSKIPFQKSSRISIQPYGQYSQLSMRSPVTTPMRLATVVKSVGLK